MGYLDNSTITVDAILTKQGRRLLAQGRQLNIGYFSLTDTGVDYTLWNTDHPSGSAKYGEAIENLPQVEAIPSAEYFMRNKLVTLDKDTTAMPIVDGQSVADHAFEDVQTAKRFEPSLLNHAEPVGFQLVVPDSSLIEITADGGEVGDYSGVALQFINTVEIANAKVYAGKQFVIKPKPSQSPRKITVTFISETTGAWRSIDLSWNSNLDPAVVTATPIG
tara:strand:- start:188 stop:847 length:660 start_codon:yes stop_codon:yes gene_type:complete